MNRSLLLLLPASLLLSGCLGDLLSWGCEFAEDGEHCWQAAAVQEAEPVDCEKVITERFEHSNPPKDKCYLQIAENTGNPSVCDEIVGGPASYTREGCLNSVLSDHHPNECDGSLDEVACRTVYATHGRGCGEGYEFVSGVCDRIKTPEDYEEFEDALDAETLTSHISKAEQAEIDSFTEAAGGKYMELIQQDIDSSQGSRKAGLEAYQNFLEESGETMGEIQTNIDNLLEMRRIFLDAYDPANDIANFDVENELGAGFTDQIKERLFGKDDPPTGLERDNALAEDALSIYALMLEQQADNDFMRQGLMGRLSSLAIDKIKDELTEKVKEQAINIAKAGAGTAFGAVTHVGEALESFKDEAKHQMFLGLSRAYNRRRDALLQEMPNSSDAERHAAAVRQIKVDAYRDNTQLAFVKHGNIIENADCQNSNNQLCIDDRVWWTAMDKTYNYNQ